MRFTLIHFIIFILLAGALPCVGQKKDAGNKLSLDIKTNSDCTILIDGSNKGLLKSGAVKTVLLAPGSYKLVAQPVNKDFEIISTTYTVSSENMNKENSISFELSKPGKPEEQKEESGNWFMHVVNNLVEKHKLSW